MWLKRLSRTDASDYINSSYKVLSTTSSTKGLYYTIFNIDYSIILLNFAVSSGDITYQQKITFTENANDIIKIRQRGNDCHYIFRTTNTIYFASF